jgi:Leucine-rich repeat (LRR) protein
MATVLNFVRGIDLRENNFEGGKFPSKAENLTGLRWINIDRTNVHYLPEELEKMTKLEEISMKHNKLRSLHGELASITTLKQIIASDNHLQNKGIPPQLFRAEKSLDQKVLDNDKREGSDLQVLDLSKNELEEVPKDLECAKDLIVLNLSHNNIDQIRQNLFLEVNGLKYLNLSYNKLDSIPSKCRRLIRLKHLDISNNPLEMAQLRFLPDLTTLTHVNLSNTKRTKSNTPLNFEKLVNLIELNFSENDLVDIPECCFTLKNLKKLNLSLNLIKNLPLHIDSWAKTLEVFNIRQ